MADCRSAQTGRIHGAIAKRIQDGADVETGAYRVTSVHDWDGRIEIERELTINPSIQVMCIENLITQEISALQAALRNVQRAFGKSLRRNSVTEKWRPARVRTGESTKDERAYIDALKKYGVR